MATMQRNESVEGSKINTINTAAKRAMYADYGYCPNIDRRKPRIGYILDSDDNYPEGFY